MDKIKAKPISKSFWILRKDNKKIGQLIEHNNMYLININGERKTYKSKSELDMIEFVEIPFKKEVPNNIVEGYPTNSMAFNGVWNTRYNIPLYTTAKDSKSLIAAGWYKVIIDKKEEIIFCPKFLTLQRNKYNGPYKTKPELMYNRLFE